MSVRKISKQHFIQCLPVAQTLFNSNQNNKIQCPDLLKAETLRPLSVDLDGALQHTEACEKLHSEIPPSKKGLWRSFELVDLCLVLHHEAFLNAVLTQCLHLLSTLSLQSGNMLSLFDATSLVKVVITRAQPKRWGKTACDRLTSRLGAF